MYDQLILILSILVVSKLEKSEGKYFTGLCNMRMSVQPSAEQGRRKVRKFGGSINAMPFESKNV